MDRRALHPPYGVVQGQRLSSPSISLTMSPWVYMVLVFWCAGFGAGGDEPWW